MDYEIESELNEMQETLLEYRSMIPINSMELDEECRRQAEKFELIGQLASRARSLAKKSKAVFEFVAADLKLKIRKNPEGFGLSGKVTNDAVNETLTIQEEYQQAQDDYFLISKIASDFSNLVSSMEQRKAMLRDLVGLYIHKYFSNQSLVGEEKSLDKRFEDEIAEERQRDIEEEEDY